MVRQVSNSTIFTAETPHLCTAQDPKGVEHMHFTRCFVMLGFLRGAEVGGKNGCKKSPDLTFEEIYTRWAVLESFTTR